MCIYFGRQTEISSSVCDLLCCHCIIVLASRNALFRTGREAGSPVVESVCKLSCQNWYIELCLDWLKDGSHVGQALKVSNYGFILFGFLCALSCFSVGLLHALIPSTFWVCIVCIKKIWFFFSSKCTLLPNPVLFIQWVLRRVKHCFW